MRDTTSRLGCSIKEARKRKHLTQLELSEQLGISPRHLQAIENENQTPSFDLLSRILSYLEISADRVLAEETEETPAQEQLLYLIRHKCDSRDISVLLSTAEALIRTKE